MSKLYKTTIVIWSDSDPKNMEIDHLAKDAVDGDSICDERKTVPVDEKDKSVPEGVLSFFNLLEE